VIICCPLMMELGRFVELVMMPNLEAKKND
jgi:hypothetical protein